MVTFDGDGFEEGWHPGGSCLPGTTLWNCLLCGVAGAVVGSNRAGRSAELARMVPPVPVDYLRNLNLIF